MIKLLGILLAVISFIPSSLDAHVLSKRAAELPSKIDTRWTGRVGEDSEELPVDQGVPDVDSRLGKSYRDENDDYYHDDIPQNDDDEEEEEYRSDERETRGDELNKFEEYKKWEKDQYEEKKDGKSEARLFDSVIGSRPRVNLAEFQRRGNPHLLELAPENEDQNQKSGSRRVKNEPSSAVHFSYTHPEKWSIDSPECSGQLQSPIDFGSEKLIALDVPSNLVWTGYWNRPNNLTISDTGHSVELRGIWKDEETPFITGGPLIGDYLFAQVHFHWGKQDSKGSEHTINNKSFPMEMHIVHYKKNYGKFENALKYQDGLAVVGFFFELNETPNSGLNLLADSLSRIQNNPGFAEPVQPHPLGLLHPTFAGEYAAYIGSLTTPPCREIVTWLISARSLPVSKKQMDSFRKISNKWPEKENYRPKQALNGRSLYYVEK